jgi:hypothetical protein
MAAINTAVDAKQAREKLPGRQAYLSLTICLWKARRVIAMGIDTVARRHATFIAHPNKNA